ncbi:uncharacterized protein LOC120008877 [Tripterygium wilfordii]|uniref:uncharacterized protein LOC120008877 n=1 Tax=Tripterygium wilfordii TaxID=458696 RepID=UPI0018F85CFB|nr:uncharacterized protein LOC120008877 [Tripterygium wilfordii]
MPAVFGCEVTSWMDACSCFGKEYKIWSESAYMASRSVAVSKIHLVILEACKSALMFSRKKKRGWSCPNNLHGMPKNFGAFFFSCLVESRKSWSCLTNTYSIS